MYVDPWSEILTIYLLYSNVLYSSFLFSFWFIISPERLSVGKANKMSLKSAARNALASQGSQTDGEKKMLLFCILFYIWKSACREKKRNLALMCFSLSPTISYVGWRKKYSILGRKKVFLSFVRNYFNKRFFMDNFIPSNSQAIKFASIKFVSIVKINRGKCKIEGKVQEEISLFPSFFLSKAFLSLFLTHVNQCRNVSESTKEIF